MADGISKAAERATRNALSLSTALQRSSTKVTHGHRNWAGSWVEMSLVNRFHPENPEVQRPLHTQTPSAKKGGLGLADSCSTLWGPMRVFSKGAISPPQAAFQTSPQI